MCLFEGESFCGLIVFVEGVGDEIVKNGEVR